MRRMAGVQISNDPIDRMCQAYWSKSGVQFYGFDADGKGDASGDPYVDQTLVKGRMETDAEKRKALFKELKRMGKTILISSHILSELADCCTSIGIIERGQLLLHGPIETVYRQIQRNRHIEVRFAGNPSTRRERHMYVTNVMLEDRTEIVLRAKFGNEPLVLGRELRIAQCEETHRCSKAA